jgi:hypothetical protein
VQGLPPSVEATPGTCPVLLPKEYYYDGPVQSLHAGDLLPLKQICAQVQVGGGEGDKLPTITGETFCFIKRESKPDQQVS